MRSLGHANQLGLEQLGSAMLEVAESQEEDEDFWREAKHSLVFRAIDTNQPQQVEWAIDIVLRRNTARKHRLCLAKYLHRALASGKYRSALHLLVMCSRGFLHEGALDSIFACEDFSLDPCVSGVSDMIASLVQSERIPGTLRDAKLYKQKLLFVTCDAWFYHEREREQIVEHTLWLLGCFMDHFNTNKAKAIMNVVLKRCLKLCKALAEPCAEYCASIMQWWSTRDQYRLYEISTAVANAVLLQACDEGARATHIRAICDAGMDSTSARQQSTALSRAVQSGNLETVKALLESRASYSSSSSLSKKRKLPDDDHDFFKQALICAASCGDREIVNHLLFHTPLEMRETCLDAILEMGGKVKFRGGRRVRVTESSSS